jgi:hypothetical protein
MMDVPSVEQQLAEITWCESSCEVSRGLTRGETLF